MAFLRLPWGHVSCMLNVVCHHKWLGCVCIYSVDRWSLVSFFSKYTSGNSCDVEVFFALLQWKLCVRLYRLFIRVVCGVWKGFSHSILPDVSFFGCVTCLGKIWKSVLSFCDMTEQKIIKEFSSVFPVGGKRLKVFFSKSK